MNLDLTVSRVEQFIDISGNIWWRHSLWIRSTDVTVDKPTRSNDKCL